ncbi:MAG: DEAD/DEAH box helicase [Candidatus Thermoplasmatota archaeon]
MCSVFSELKPEIQKVLLSEGIQKPTEPQKKAIPSILKRKNVLLIAPTGLGKTEAALLPIFNDFISGKNKDKNRKGISILYITPLRALNRDMLKRTFDWGKKLGIKIAVRHGDTPRNERRKQSINPPDMLITTPETFQILFTGKRLRKNLSSVKYLIIDEIHELASDDRGMQLSVAIERLEELKKEDKDKIQRIGLSATVGSPEEVAKYLAGMIKGRYRPVETVSVDVTKHIDIKVEMPKITENDYTVSNKFSLDPGFFASIRRCKQLIKNHVSSLIFTNTRDTAEILGSRFHRIIKDLSIGVHHGSLSKNTRIQAEDKFKNSDLKALICTSSLELGIDVGATDFVIQYNSPRQVKRIIQRVGRSGHKVGEISKGLILATSEEELCEGMAIARRGLNGEIEKIEIRENPLLVLTNQIISIVLEYRKISKKDLFNIIKRSYPFRNLKREDFEEIITQLRKQRSIWIEKDEFIIKRRSSRTYFLDNISMIPDEKTYTAVDISSREKVGKLDESFVLKYIFEGAKIILSGRAWKVIRKEEDEIILSQSDEIGDVPSWAGEDIPIPYDVALEVGRIRRKIRDNENLDEYPCDKDSLKNLSRLIKNQKEQGFVLPDDKNITIEVGEKKCVINLCFGTRVNETLGRLISALLAQSMGESIGINNDAYRISLEIPGRINIKKIDEIFYETKPESLDYLLKTILKNSNYIRWELVHVARKFGALKKEFDYKKVGMKKLFNLFKKTSIFDEAVDKIIWERMDIKNSKKVLSKIQSDEIKIHHQRISPISEAGFESTKGIMVPQRANRAILMALKKRIENTPITLVCINCHNKWNKNVRRTTEKPLCPKCRAKKIGILKRYNKQTADLLEKKNRTEEENKKVRRLLKNSSLVLSYGKPAIIALMARGIGPDTTARILRKYSYTELRNSEEKQIDFLRDILKAELTYARTRGFWDD